MAKRTIPSNNAEFTMWFTQLFTIVQENTTNMEEPAWDHIPTAAVEELQDVYEEWHTAYMKSLPPHGADVTAEVNQVRAKTEAVLRPFIQRYLYWYPVTDAQRVQMGLTLHDTTRTPHIEVHELLELDISLHGINELILHPRVKGSENKAKPTGYDGAVIVAYISENDKDEPPVNPADWSIHFMVSIPDYIWTLDPKHRGKKVHVAGAWQNARGNLGTFSEVVSAIIP